MWGEKKLNLIEFGLLIWSANEFKTRGYSHTGSRQLMGSPRGKNFVGCLEGTGRFLKLWQ